MWPTLNKHVLGCWCQQNSSVYEIIFSLNECLNELLSPVALIPGSVFNISRALFFWVALSVLVTHCLEIGNVYISLVLAGRDKWVGQSPKPSLCFTARLAGPGALAAPLWLTDNITVTRGGGLPSLKRARQQVSCLDESWKCVEGQGRRGRAPTLFSWCEAKSASQVLLTQVFGPAISSYGSENRK